MIRLIVVASLLLPAFASAGIPETESGIPLTSAWRRSVYAYASQNVKHPAWGLPHSERDYHLALKLAMDSGFAIDTDVLFASAFLHDLGGLPGFERDGVDHAVRSAELAPEILMNAGFPAEKIPAVQDMIRGHVYYGPAPASLEAQAFRDADILDFLGAIGVARILGVTDELGGGKGINLAVGKKVLDGFAASMASKASLPVSRPIAETRLKELTVFLQALDAESLSGRAL